MFLILLPVHQRVVPSATCRLAYVLLALAVLSEVPVQVLAVVHALVGREAHSTSAALHAEVEVLEHLRPTTAKQYHYVFAEYREVNS